MRKKKKSLLTTILLVFILLVGLSVMLYPTVSNWWNIKVQTRAIATYDKAVSNLDDSEKMKMFPMHGIIIISWQSFRSHLNNMIK